jgi:glycogen debranching enzyme
VIDRSPAGGIGERTLVLKRDRYFALLTANGEITPPGCASLGLFRDDTRILSHYALRFAGGTPARLSTDVRRMFRAQIDLAINDQEFGGDPWDPKNCIHIRRELLLDDSLRERVTLTNYLTRPIAFWMELDIAVDFADIFEVRGWARSRRGEIFAPVVGDRTLVFSYRGVDGMMQMAGIRFASPPNRIGPEGAAWRCTLDARARVAFEWEIVAGESWADKRAAVPLGHHAERLDEEYAAWVEACSGWRSDVAAFNGMVERAVEDMHALSFKCDGHVVPAAGIPWYATIFGRDSIITALQTLPLNPAIAVDTLRFLAEKQGRTYTDFTEEEPGKIMHELRRGEMARSGEIPHVPYYGSVDATGLWLVLFHETWRWTGDTELVRELLPSAERALQWIDRFGDMDGDGLVEYSPRSSRGLSNQGWKDSGDGVPFPDGSLPCPPVALVEVQGYVYDGKLRLGALYEALGRHEDALRLAGEADRLRSAIEERFWLEESGTYALALDGAKRPVPTVTTNAGHLLWSRVPAADRAERLASRLFEQDMFSGWGLRTLSAAHPVFNPMSYHNGSVWPHDNALIALGLGFYGRHAEAGRILSALYDACAEMQSNRLPELYCGMERAPGMPPVRYPVSCSPQAWASGAFFMVLQAALGLFPAANEGTLHVRTPVLPEFLRELTVTRLRVGGSLVSLQFRRHRDRTLVNLLEVEGAPLRVQIDL